MIGIANNTIRGSIVCMMLASCGAMEVSESVSPEGDITVPYVYTRYLQDAVPSGGIEAEFNPPVLRWPLAKGDSVRYDIRLSMDSTFTDAPFFVTGTPWAMFNPHERLASGVWYWQYRRSGTAWSNVCHFVVNEASIELVSPAADRFLAAIGKEHPRILARASEIQTLRSVENDSDAEAIIRAANAALIQPVPREDDGRPRQRTDDKERNRKYRQDASSALGKRTYTSVAALCQAWILTGDERYRSHATAIAMEVAGWDPAGVTGSKTNDFADARCMLSMALVFDTFYHFLSEEARARLQDAITHRASGFYLSWINNQEARLLSGHVWQHILHYFFETSLALHGHEPDAGRWLAYAYDLFLARAPILGGKAGGWAEGASYFRMNMETLINIPLYIQDYTGFDFIKAHPWYVNNVSWLVYHISPGSSSDGFGDNAEEVFSPGAEYQAFAREIAKLTGSRLASWYAQECARHEPLNLSQNDMLRWVRLAKTRDIPMPEAEIEGQLPLGKLFPELGLVFLHSEPAQPSKGLAIALRSSPFGSYGHFLSDQNAFNILYGGKRTLFRTGYKVTMTDPHRTGWYQHTKSNNSILVNGNGQPYSSEAFGWVRKLISGEHIAYTLADASNAYSSLETKENYGVTRFYRHVVLLKPDIVVIYDELEAADDLQWSWLVHSLAPIEQKANTFASSFEHASAVGKLWSSSPVVYALADTFDVPAVNWRGSRDSSGKQKTYDDEQWHLRAETSRTKACRFLTILRVSPGASVESIVGMERKSSLDISAGEWEISCALNTKEHARLDIRRRDGSATFWYQTGSPPFVAEDWNGKRKVIKGMDIMPAQLKQTLLHHGKNQMIR